MNDEWISASDTIDLARSAMSINTAHETICSRAFDGLIATRAKLLIWGKIRTEECEINPSFWWARGRAALDQNWRTGDFETWIDRSVHVRAYGVRFSRVGVENMLGHKIAATQADVAASESIAAAPAEKATAAKGGRKRSDFWNLMTVEIARRVYAGDITPPVVAAEMRESMLAWLATEGETPDKTTVDPFFKLLAKALNDEYYLQE